MNEIMGMIGTSPVPMSGYEDAAQGIYSYSVQLNHINQMLQAQTQTPTGECDVVEETSPNAPDDWSNCLRQAANAGTQFAIRTPNTTPCWHYYLGTPQTAWLELNQVPCEEGLFFGSTQSLNYLSREYNYSIRKMCLSFFIDGIKSRSKGDLTRPFLSQDASVFKAATGFQFGRWINQSVSRLKSNKPGPQGKTGDHFSSLTTARLILRHGTALERGEALLALIARGDPDVAQYIGHELAQTRELDWKAILVVAAEQARLEAGSFRNAIKAELRRAAKQFNETQSSEWEPVVWSAIRRYASMLAREEVGALGEFLDWTGPIDARQVTLQGIQNIFRTLPCEGGDEVGELRNQVFRLAQNSLRPESLASGKPAALAMNAIASLAAIGDRRLPLCVQAVLSWRRPWFTRQVRKLLFQTSSEWPAGCATTARITMAIHDLELN